MKNPNRIFTEVEMKQLLRAIRERSRRGTMLDRIDHALITFSWATGCRASEIASMSIDRNQPNHIDLESGIVSISEAKWSTTSHHCPLDTRSLRILRWYVREIRPLIRNSEILDRLFITKTGSVYTPNKMSKKLSMMLSRYGFPTKTAHSLRHFFCTDLFRNGASLPHVKSLMHHRDVRSTMIYSHVTVSELRATVNRRIS